MSEREEASGRWRTRVGAVLAPLAFVGLWVAPLPLEAPAHRLAAIFGAVLILWVSEVVPIAVTALLIAPLLVVSDVARPSEAFRHYADPLLYLFVGGFFIAEAMSAHGLDRRIAKAIVTSRGIGGVPSRVNAGLMFAAFVLSMWISNTAAMAILVPILLKMVAGRAATGAVLGLAYAASIGGLGTLVGSPPNGVTVQLLGTPERPFGFLEWSMVGMPAALILGLAVFFLVRRLFPAGDAPAVGAPAFDDVPAEWSRGERATLVVFVIAVAGWLAPGVATALDLPFASWLDQRLDAGVVALGAALILFAVPDGRGERVLTWRRAAGIDWGVILLFGGGIALGKQLVATGLAQVMAEGFIELTGIESMWVLTFVACAFTIFFTEICSNTATATMLVPLVMATATALGVSPIPPALGVGVAASCAFMLPIATGPNAIAYSTGQVSQGQMIRAGFVLNVVSIGVVFAVLRVLCPLYGWD